MSALADIKFLTWVLDKLATCNEKQKEQVNEAIKAIHAAWTRTYDYLKNKDGAYVPNQQLSDLWNDAASKTRLINPDLAQQLSDKSRFWIHPNIPRQNRILLLAEVTDEIKRLNKKFE